MQLTQAEQEKFKKSIQYKITYLMDGVLKTQELTKTKERQVKKTVQKLSKVIGEATDISLFIAIILLEELMLVIIDLIEISKKSP